MQQKVLLVCKIHFFCIYFSFNNFNYPNKEKSRIKLPKFFRKSFAEFPQNFCRRKIKLARVLRSGYPKKYTHFRCFSENHSCGGFFFICWTTFSFLIFRCGMYLYNRGIPSPRLPSTSASLPHNSPLCPNIFRLKCFSLELCRVW